MGVIRPRSMPIVSLRTLAICARQLVVQDAFEMTVCCAASYLSSLTPMTIVMSSFLAGAEMMTFLAPLSACTLALVASVKKPVDSMTTSAPRSLHLRLAGSRSPNALKVLPPTVISSAVALTSCGSRPRIESYLSRCASVALSVRSFTPTSSMSAPEASTARKKLRPIRPKPLMPTRIVTGGSPRFGPPGFVDRRRVYADLVLGPAKLASGRRAPPNRGPVRWRRADWRRHGAHRPSCRHRRRHANPIGAPRLREQRVANSEIHQNPTYRTREHQS